MTNITEQEARALQLENERLLASLSKRYQELSLLRQNRAIDREAASSMYSVIVEIAEALKMKESYPMCADVIRRATRVIRVNAELLAACEHFVQEYHGHIRIQYVRVWERESIQRIEAAITEAKELECQPSSPS